MLFLRENELVQLVSDQTDASNTPSALGDTVSVKGYRKIMLWLDFVYGGANSVPVMFFVYPPNIDSVTLEAIYRKTALELSSGISTINTEILLLGFGENGKYCIELELKKSIPYLVFAFADANETDTDYYSIKTAYITGSK